MKLKALLLALVVAGLTASYALADDGGHGKGKGKSGHGLVASTSADTTTTTGDDADGDDDGAHEGKAKAKAKQETCRPSFSVNLAGKVATAPSADSFALLVSKGNAHGRKLAGKQLTVDASHAKVVKHGKRKAADLAAGDRVLVKARACVDLAEGTVSVVARQVVVLGGKHDDGSSTSTSTSTSTTTSTDSTTSTTESTTTAGS